jgi:hypothetical protein
MSGEYINNREPGSVWPGMSAAKSSGLVYLSGKSAGIFGAKFGEQSLTL